MTVISSGFINLYVNNIAAGRQHGQITGNTFTMNNVISLNVGDFVSYRFSGGIALQQ